GLLRGGAAQYDCAAARDRRHSGPGARPDQKLAAGDNGLQLLGFVRVVLRGRGRGGWFFAHEAASSHVPGGATLAALTYPSSCRVAAVCIATPPASIVVGPPDDIKPGITGLTGYSGHHR